MGESAKPVKIIVTQESNINRRAFSPTASATRLYVVRLDDSPGRPQYGIERVVRLKPSNPTQLTNRHE